MKQILLMHIPLAIVSLSVAASSSHKQKAIKTEQKTHTKKDSKMTARTQTQSGLEFETTQPGSGPCPEHGKKVTVHYTGWLNDGGRPGTKFDSSRDRGTPFTFVLGVGQVIKGWDEGVASMQVGEKRRLFIPSSLAYGARGAGSIIKPHADLIFDVELLSVG